VRVKVAMIAKRSVSVRLPEPLADDLKARAAEEGVSLTEMINRFARLGLKLTAEEQFPVYGGLPESYGNSHGLGDIPRQVQEPSNGYALSTQMVLAANSHEAEARPPKLADDDPEALLLAGFDEFTKTLESSMRYLTDERNRDRVVKTIGKLAELKTRLQLDSCFQK